MSYEGGGSQGPAGPTGPTGATGSGGFTFSGPTGSILWYDGSGVTGNNGLVYDGFSTISNEATNNYITLDGMGQLVVGIGNTDAGNVLNLFAGNTSFLLRDAQTGDTVAPGNLEIIINGDSGTTGQYLGSDGAGLVTWSTPTPIYTVSAYGQTGATGPLINNGLTGTQLMSTSITTGVTGHILGQVAIQIQNSMSSDLTVGVYLVVAGSTGGTTNHTMPKQQGGNNGSANLTIFHRTTTKEPPGTYAISVYGYSNTNTDVFYDHIDLVGLGNLDGPDASPPL